MSQLTDAPSADPIDRLAVRANDAIALIGRLALGWIFLSSGFGKLADVAAFSAVLAKRGVPAPSFMGWLGAIVEFGGGVLVILGLRVRYAALLLALFVVVATAISHRYWEYPAAQMTAQKTNFVKNLAILGGALLLFVTGPGRLSIDRMLSKKG